MPAPTRPEAPSSLSHELQILHRLHIHSEKPFLLPPIKHPIIYRPPAAPTVEPTATKKSRSLEALAARTVGPPPPPPPPPPLPTEEQIVVAKKSRSLEALAAAPVSPLPAPVLIEEQVVVAKKCRSLEALAAAPVSPLPAPALIEEEVVVAKKSRSLEALAALPVSPLPAPVLTEEQIFVAKKSRSLEALAAPHVSHAQPPQERELDAGATGGPKGPLGWKSGALAPVVGIGGMGAQGGAASSGVGQRAEGEPNPGAPTSPDPKRAPVWGFWKKLFKESDPPAAPAQLPQKLTSLSPSSPPPEPLGNVFPSPTNRIHSSPPPPPTPSPPPTTSPLSHEKFKPASQSPKRSG
ncbi:hypothetical protein BDK51DRAFT_27090 [Blyttiomyces helicus]|uniref:Uncharacterized protein n=1 Tax=Blyttiomyces helicus TaxID=388810 RepID=A0A4P9WB56_9FUNG|nr:hypothetical protein BDK51DRAFT_27090 [Blyttiomyces helicus]|eukprot:RKO89472.1 hypothetical protein BDK51DRAFT_27090 [Blyttiomyces helicus]